MTDIKTPLIIEEPDGKVQREALFYCTDGSSLDGHLSFKEIYPVRHLPPRDDMSWSTRPVGAQYEEVPLPTSIGSGWKHLYLTTSDEELAKGFCSKELSVSRDYVADHIPDFTAWPNFMIVSARTRGVLEELAPGRSSFLDLAITKSTGEPVRGQFFYWIVRDRFFFKPQYHDGPHKTQMSSFNSAPFGGIVCNWQLLNNGALRDYLSKLPFWGLGLEMMYVAYNAPTFARLRAERFTGLVECISEERQPNENIMHIPLEVETLTEESPWTEFFRKRFNW